MLWLFAVSVGALIVSPGPDFFYVLGRGVAQGRRAGVLAAVGIALGLVVHTSLAVLGLSALLKTSDPLFWAVKTLGALYLVWIGFKMLRSRADDLPEGKLVDGRALVRGGFVTNVSNPKAALTFLAFLPQWVQPGGPSASAQIALLGAVTVAMALGWFSLVGAFAGSVREGWKRHPRVGEWAQKATGAVLLLLGCRLVLERR